MNFPKYLSIPPRMLLNSNLPVRRKLFDEDDSSEETKCKSLNKDFNSIKTNAALNWMQRWNFDIVNETPVKGKFKWQILSTNDSKSKKSLTNNTLSKDTTKTKLRISNKTKSKQRRLTEFYVKRSHPNFSKLTVSSKLIRRVRKRKSDDHQH